MDLYISTAFGAVKAEQNEINVSTVAINITPTKVIEAHIYLFIYYFLRNGNHILENSVLLCVCFFFFF